MKDYFDLRALAREGAVGQDVLADAIAATFGRRGTALPAELPLGLTDAFAHNAEKRAQWKAFLGKNRLKAPTLDEVIAEVRDFLAMPLRRAWERSQHHRR
jgi:hypothetical protein